MRSLPAPQDVSAPIRQITLDLSSARGGAFDGFSRLLINCIRDAEGELRRIGGWTRLADGNGDLHDQLLGAISAPLPVVESTLEIYNQPDGVTFVAGNGFGMFAEARGGVTPYTWQWYKRVGSVWLLIKDDTNEFGEVAIPAASGYASQSLAIDPASASDAGLYRVTVTDSDGATVNSNSALAATAAGSSYQVAPKFTVQPVGGTNYAGQTITLTAEASGVPGPSLQWQKYVASVWTDIVGKTATTLQLGPLVSGDAGDYRCVATNTAGTAYSNTATLAVLASSSYTDVNHIVNDFECGQNNPGKTITLTNPRADQTLTVTWGAFSGPCAAGFSISPSPVVIAPSGSQVVTIGWDLTLCSPGGEYQDGFIEGAGTFSGGAPGLTVYVEVNSNLCP